MEGLRENLVLSWRERCCKDLWWKTEGKRYSRVSIFIILLFGIISISFFTLIVFESYYDCDWSVSWSFSFWYNSYISFYLGFKRNCLTFSPQEVNCCNVIFFLFSSSKFFFLIGRHIDSSLWIYQQITYLLNNFLEYNEEKQTRYSPSWFMGMVK